jgi:hypothetical protein
MKLAPCGLSLALWWRRYFTATRGLQVPLEAALRARSSRSGGPVATAMANGFRWHPLSSAGAGGVVRLGALPGRTQLAGLRRDTAPTPCTVSR